MGPTRHHARRNGRGRIVSGRIMTVIVTRHANTQIQIHPKGNGARVQISGCAATLDNNEACRLANEVTDGRLAALVQAARPMLKADLTDAQALAIANVLTHDLTEETMRQALDYVAALRAAVKAFAGEFES